MTDKPKSFWERLFEPAPPRMCQWEWDHKWGPWSEPEHGTMVNRATGARSDRMVQIRKCTVCNKQEIDGV